MRPSAFPGNRDAGMVRLYAGVMAVTAAAAVAFALFATHAAPRYSASAEVLIDPAITPSGNYIQPSMPTEQRVATSSEVIGAVAKKLGVTSKEVLDQLDVSVPVDTQVLVMTYTSGTPADALAGADAMAQTYLKARNPAKADDAVASVVGTPGLPSEPLTTNYPVVLGVAVVGGLLVGFMVAWAWDRVRGRVRTIADAEHCADLDALATLPRGALTGAGMTSIDRTHLDSLAARVLGQVEGGPRPSVLITGAGLDGSSTAVAVQTALGLSRMGRTVILMTADHDVVANLSLDPAQRHRASRIADGAGQTYAARVPGLHLLLVGEWDTGGVVASKLANLLPDVQERLPEALVVIDGPVAWQSSGLALRADTILLVVAVGRNSRTATVAAVQALDHCRSKLMGLVIAPREGRAARAWAWLRRRQRTTQVMRPAPPPLATPTWPDPQTAPVSSAPTRVPPPEVRPARPAVMAPRFQAPPVCDPATRAPLINASTPRSQDRPSSRLAPPQTVRTHVVDLADQVWDIRSRGSSSDAGRVRVPRPQPTWSTPA